MPLAQKIRKDSPAQGEAGEILLQLNSALDERERRRGGKVVFTET